MADLAPLSAEADSASWMGQKANQVNIFDEFLAQVKAAELKKRWGARYSQTPEEELCAQEIHEHFATFLLKTYVIPKGRKNAGNHLHNPTPVFAGIINQVSTKYSTSAKASTIAFLQCLTVETSASAVWLRGMKRKLDRETFQRDMLSGELQDGSASAFYLLQVKGLCASYAKCDGKKAALRKLAIKTLQRTAGRASEVGFLSYDKMKFDRQFDAPFQEVPQSKTSKIKLIPFIAGADRHSDWFIDWADLLVLDRGLTPYAHGDCWIMPEIHGKTAGTKVGAFIKAMLPKEQGGAAEYEQVAPLDEFGESILPPKPSAAGIRPDACDLLATSMPAEIGVHTSGHDMRDISAFWEYLNSRMALCIPGALVLSGWPKLPWGELGSGPRAPSLMALVNAGVAVELLETYMDLLYSLNGRPPPALLRGGDLRPALRIATATLFMYYEERFAANEMASVLASMRECYSVFGQPRADAHAVIIQWGKAIMQKFDVENLHLSRRNDHGLSQQVFGAVQQLGAQLGRVHGDAFTADEDRQGLRLVRIEENLGAFTLMPVVVPTPSPHKTPISITPAFDAESAAQLLPGIAEPSIAEPSIAEAVATPFLFGSLQRDLMTTPTFYSLADCLAKDLYLEKTRPGHVPKCSSQDQTRADNCCKWFDCMATPEEAAALALKPRDEEAALEIVEGLVKHSRSIIEAGLRLRKETVGRIATTKFLVNTLDRMQARSGVLAERGFFQRFRRGEAEPAKPAWGMSAFCQKRPREEAFASEGSPVEVGSETDSDSS